jgi:hypothetical protein
MAAHRDLPVAAGTRPEAPCSAGKEFVSQPLEAAGIGAPDGIPFNQAVVRWALENYLGVIDRDPQPSPFEDGNCEPNTASEHTSPEHSQPPIELKPHPAAASARR